MQKCPKSLSGGMRVTLYQPDIAANLGAIMRSTACFDTELSIIEPCGFPLSAKSLRRAAMDYGTPKTLIRHASWDIYQNTPKIGRRILLTTKGAQDLTDFSFLPDDELIFGRESAGVPEKVHAAMDARIIIPISPETRSFNLSNAVAIVLWEALRQTHKLPQRD
ncbi:MAG: tRNA (cytidine(34)-2'-O)-methyltransferase [Litorimonas sp.]